jgi:uncharacterized protein
MRLATVLVACLFACSSAAARAADPTPPPAPAPAATWSPASTTTEAGIPLDAPWKTTIYAFAREHFHHPAWGWQHSERDYLLAMQFAKEDGIAVDPDVLFAAAMMHDMAAFAPWDTEMKGTKIEHGDIAAKDCPPILRAAGFPMQKIAAVQAAESGHMFYSEAKLPEAIVLHDADSVDFLGDVGIARILATVGEGKPSMNGALTTLRSFIVQIPPRLITKAAKRAAVPRIAEMTAFMDRMKAESAVQ